MFEEARRRRLIILLAGLAAFTLGIVGFFASPYFMPGVNQWFADLQSYKLPHNDPEYLYYQAQRYRMDGQTGFATATARRAVIVDPTYAPARKFLAAEYFKQKQYDSAAEQCREILLRDPHDSTAKLGLAAAETRLGKTKEARSLYESIATETVGTTPDAQRDAARDALLRMDDGSNGPVGNP